MASLALESPSKNILLTTVNSWKKPLHFSFSRSPAKPPPGFDGKVCNPSHILYCSLLPAPSPEGYRARRGPLATEGTGVTQSPCSDSLSHYFSLWRLWSLHPTLFSVPWDHGPLYTRLPRQSKAEQDWCPTNSRLCPGGLWVQCTEQPILPHLGFPHWTPKRELGAGAARIQALFILEHKWSATLP